jgi:hypothetical protein
LKKVKSNKERANAVANAEKEKKRLEDEKENNEEKADDAAEAPKDILAQDEDTDVIF